MCWLFFIFVGREFTQSVYSGKFSNLNNVFNVTNVRN